MTNRCMHLGSIPVTLLFITLLFAGLGWAQPPSPAGLITGTVSYRQRIALPPDAVVEVSLLDASIADVPARLISQVKIPTQGMQVPIPFRLEFQPSAIQPSGHYQLSAKITENDNPLFVTTQGYPAFTDSRPAEGLAILLEQVQPDARAQFPLEDTYWSLIELHGRPVPASNGSNGAHIVLHAVGKDFTGNGGCNRLMGSFIREGKTLRFKVVGSTMMACPSPQMKREQAFTRALGITTRYQITGRFLELSDGSQSVARFEAQPMK